MIIGNKGIKYGLSAPAAKQKAKAVVVKPLNVFGDDDESGDESKAVGRDIARQGVRKLADTKIAQMHERALAEDASVFDYDGVYDSIQEQRVQPKQAEKLARKSRYIEGLLQKAEERKKEEDIVYERRLAKERAAEDHLFGDKESFVTAAYKRKLQEDKIWLERERLREEHEAANDVVKKGHMGDFYRNVMTKNVDFGSEASKGRTGDAADGAASNGGTAASNGDAAWEAARAARQQYEEAQGAGEPVQEDLASGEAVGTGPATSVPGAGLLADSENPLLAKQAKLLEAAKRREEAGAAPKEDGDKDAEVQATAAQNQCLARRTAPLRHGSGIWPASAKRLEMLPDELLHDNMGTAAGPLGSVQPSGAPYPGSTGGRTLARCPVHASETPLAVSTGVTSPVGCLYRRRKPCALSL
eukprot:jgi/Botrbrau1/21155/Bobra.0061s0049.1